MGKDGKWLAVKCRVAIILLGVVGYALTMARTVSFWDCGEFIAASNVLGIAHPPGSPLFILLGRVFILLFGWINGPAFAVNLISVVSSIICCLLIFEITTKISQKKHLGFFAASISLFGNTFWFNAVEAGTYNISMMMIMLQIWAVLKWSECGSNKYLLLILYLAFLGLGIHMFALLPLPAIIIYVLIKKRAYLVQLNRARHALSLQAILFIALGLSARLYLPIRSSTEPLMNQNNPAKIENFWDVLNRKQYGDMNMFERAFYRRGSFANQFGFSENIGYLGYHLEQWVPAPFGAQNPNGWFHRIIFQFLIIAVFAGLWAQRKNLNVIFMATMFLLSSAGLVLYLNFADGTRIDSPDAKLWKTLNLPNPNKLNSQLKFYYALPKEIQKSWLENAPAAEGLRKIFEQGIQLPRLAQREVRNRDYFFTPAFLFFAIMAAIACGSARVPKYALIFAWVIPFACNFESNNRSKDFIARDFAMNVLDSVPENSILITYGDNDTFPLWYMQMAENYRTDVVVINEILFYSEWYRKQIFKTYPNLTKCKSIACIIKKHWPERSVNFMLGARLEDYAMFSENAPLIGLVRSLGMENSTADSLLLENLTKNYRYGELKARGQEANEQTIDIYKYLARIALLKEHREEQREILSKLSILP